jgi:hypothetical protein
MVLIFRKHRSVFSVAIAVLMVFGVTTALLLWGMAILEKGPVIKFFNKTISSGELYRLIAFWYAVDTVCAALIIRSHMAYRKANPQGERKRHG